MSSSRDGLVLLNKPPEMTSFQALKPVKQRLQTGKIGHTGTLDRFADGLLIAAGGACSRFAPYVTALPKEYYAVLQLGIETDTLDPEGEITASSECPSFEALEHAATQFRGEFMQTPPVYSAIKLEGRRASVRKRAGDDPRLEARPVTVYELELGRYETETGRLNLRVLCSKGTYVRALARDLSYAAGSCAHLVALRRTAVGGFRLEDAVHPDEFDRERDLVPPARFLPKLEGITPLVVEPEIAERMLHGVALRHPAFEPLRDTVSTDGVYAALTPDERLIAVLERRDGSWKYRFVKAIES